MITDFILIVGDVDTVNQTAIDPFRPKVALFYAQPKPLKPYQQLRLTFSQLG